ncbi:hypothetical protein DFH09DRAFT_1097928 [Mycena vulgaris]|nr:hypothetical protein DFH09DRAFT_1097928 [Mycena vulgaris]
MHKSGLPLGTISLLPSRFVELVNLLNKQTLPGSIVLCSFWVILHSEGLFAAASMNILMQCFIQTDHYLAFRDHLVLKQKNLDAETDLSRGWRHNKEERWHTCGYGLCEEQWIEGFLKHVPSWYNSDTQPWVQWGTEYVVKKCKFHNGWLLWIAWVAESPVKWKRKLSISGWVSLEFGQHMAVLKDSHQELRVLLIIRKYKQ